MKLSKANNAPNIAAALTGVIPQVISIIPVTNTSLVFVLDLSPKAGSTTPPDETKIKSTIKDAVKKLAAQTFPVGGASQSGKPTRAEVYVTRVTNGNNASDIASALAGWPQVISVTAVTDSKLVFILDVSPKSGSNVPQDPTSLEVAIASAVSQLQTFKYPLAAHWFSVAVDPEKGNAVDIASRLATNSMPGILSIIPVGNTKLLFLLDETPDARFPTRPRDLAAMEKEIKSAVQNLQWGFPTIYVVPFALGTGKNCDVANALVRQIKGVLNIAPVGTTRLAFTIDPKIGKDGVKGIESEIDTLVSSLAEPVTAPLPNAKSFAQRLFYDHDPTTLASIIHNAFPEVSASPVVPDTVVLSEAIPAAPIEQDKRDPLEDARRVITRVDQPRPQVTLDTWSVQFSTRDQDDLAQAGRAIERIAKKYNDVIARSAADGWRYLVGHIKDPGFLDPEFSNYLTDVTFIPASETCCKRAASTALPGSSGYALGYRSLFQPLSPNLVYMLVALAASQSPAQNTSALINVVETGNPNTPALSPDGRPCQDRDLAAYNPAPPRLQLECVRMALVGQLFRESPSGASTSALGRFRAAIADWLFQYKMMMEYRDDFEPFLSSFAAAGLDAQMGPIVDAFSSDLDVFQEQIMDQVECNGPYHTSECYQLFRRKGTTYAASGIVSVKVVAGFTANVVAQTQNYFEATPPATLGDFAAAIRSISAPATGQTQPSLPKFLTSNMTVNEAVGTLAAIQTLTRPPIMAKIGKGLTLTATAYGLSGASGAEMDVTVESNENGAGLVTPPTVSNVSSTSVASDDLASRVADHKVSTHVRVDSLNLFKLSTMESVLARGKAPWKPFDPWLEVPILADVVRRPRKPDVTYHRSFIFISALVVPTSVDLANGIPFIPDGVQKDGKAPYIAAWSRPGIGGRDAWQFIHEYHNAMVDRFASEYVDQYGKVRGP